MKNNIKKILAISSSTFAAIGTSATLGISAVANDTNLNINSINSKAVVNSTFNPNKPLVFNGKTYNNIYHAIESYASNPNNVTEKMFLGDVSAATSITNKYESVNLSKLREYDLSRISKAYKTLTDSYVSSLDEAKISYLKEPVIAFTDNNGLIFDTEIEAADYMLNNNFTTPINYYEIADYSRKDSTGKPKIVKINPLNSKDVNALKKIAASNAFINGTNFTLNRKLVTNDFYENNDFKGKTDQEISALVNSLTNGITNIVKENIWINNNLVSIPDPQYIVGYARTGFASVEKRNFAINYNTNHLGENSKIGVDYNTYINESVYMTELDKFLEKFNLVDRWGGGKSPYKNAEIKSGQTVFGGQRFSFTALDDQIKTMKTFGVSDSWMGEDVSFLGRGKQSNIYFSFNPNQEQYEELLKTDESFRNQREQKTNEVVKQVEDYVKNNFKNYFDTNEINTLINDIKQPIIDSMNKKLIQKDQIWINYAKHSSQIKFGLDKIDNIILSKIEDAYKTKNGGKSFTDAITDKIASKEQYVEDKNSNDVIYTIDFNGVPLFKLDKSLFNDLYTTNNMYKVNPLEQVKNYLKSNLNTQYQNTVEKMANAMVNISNSFEETKTTVNGRLKFETYLKKDTIDRYATNPSNNFGLTAKANITNNFGGDYANKFIDESQFIKNFGLTNDKLIKNLNAKIADDDSLLFTEKGTFQAIYNYNKSLETFLKRNNPSDIQKSTLKANYVKSANDIVWLFNNDKTPLQIKYSEYFDNQYKFNQSLSDDSVLLVKSIEAKENQITSNKLNKPTKVVVVKDYLGNIVNFESINGNAITNDGYATSKEQALENAKNQVDVKESLDYVYYLEDDQSKTLLKNKVTKLNVLSINHNGHESKYGFLKYQDLYNYLFDYIKLNSDGNGSSLPDSQPPFDSNSIDTNAIASILSTVSSLDSINKLSIEDKFKTFGGAFGIADINAWKMYINNITFSPKQVGLKTSQQATMNVQLNDGYKFADGNSNLNMDITYTPSGELGPVTDVVKREKSTTALIASVTSSILLILMLEIVLISVIVINKRKQENDNEKKLMKLVNNSIKK